MAKTTFVNNKIVTSEFMNSIFLGDGHQHDGGTEDGHASKIDLTSHVQNELPIGNIQNSFAISGRNTISCSVGGTTRSVTILRGTTPVYKWLPLDASPDRTDVKYFKHSGSNYKIINDAGTDWAKIGSGGIVLASTTGFTQLSLILFAVIDGVNEYIVAATSASAAFGSSNTIYYNQIGVVFINHNTEYLREYSDYGDHCVFTVPEYTPIVDFENSYTDDSLNTIPSTIVDTASVGICYGRVKIANTHASLGIGFDLSIGTQFSYNDITVLATSNKVFSFDNMPSSVKVKSYAATGTYTIKVIVDGFHKTWNN